MVIYQIINIITSDFYIGKSNNPKVRFYKHKYNAINTKSQAFLYRAMRKYGVDNFSFTILEEVENQENLNCREVYWIEKLSPRYNMTKGGDGGDTSNSPNYKLAIKNRDQTGSKNGMYGKKRPEAAIYLLKGREKCYKPIGVLFPVMVKFLILSEKLNLHFREYVLGKD